MEACPSPPRTSLVFAPFIAIGFFLIFLFLQELGVEDVVANRALLQLAAIILGSFVVEVVLLLLGVGSVQYMPPLAFFLYETVVPETIAAKVGTYFPNHVPVARRGSFDEVDVESSEFTAGENNDFYRLASHSQDDVPGQVFVTSIIS